MAAKAVKFGNDARVKMLRGVWRRLRRCSESTPQVRKAVT